MKEQEVGIVINWFDRISVAAIRITRGTISVGDTLVICGYYQDAEFYVSRIEIDHKPVQVAMKGQEVGIMVPQRVRKGEIVCRVIPGR